MQYKNIRTPCLFVQTVVGDSFRSGGLKYVYGKVFLPERKWDGCPMQEVMARCYDILTMVYILHCESGFIVFNRNSI